jgi:aspartyl-tRNA synthetase
LVEQIDSHIGDKTVVIHGFIKSVRKLSKKLVFLDLYDYRSGPDIIVQVVSNITANSPQEQKAMHNTLLKLPPFVPVCVKGIVTKTKSPPPPGGLSADESQKWGAGSPMHRPEIQLESLIQLNSVSPDLIYTPATVFPPEKRHLQLRTSPLLANALRMRNKVSDICRQSLKKSGFLEVETPLLFKSTPEGAREFLVPTRTQGMCYALPQSPQQYKQILMASGVARYFQFAKCFRDEDLRADRQPEFTQLDLEMSFARKEDVMKIVHKLICDIFYKAMGIDLPFGFRSMTYSEAMQSYGTDKPDLRHGFLKV